MNTHIMYLYAMYMCTMYMYVMYMHIIYMSLILRTRVCYNGNMNIQNYLRKIFKHTLTPPLQVNKSMEKLKDLFVLKSYWLFLYFNNADISGKTILTSAM